MIAFFHNYLNNIQAGYGKIPAVLKINALISTVSNLSIRHSSMSKKYSPTSVLPSRLSIGDSWLSIKHSTLSV